MSSIRLSWFSFSAAAFLALAACQDGAHSPTSTTSDDPAPSRVGPEAVMAGAIDQLRLGFQPADDGYRAGTATHDAAVSGGDLVMVPHDFDGVRAIDGAPVRFSTSAVERGGVALAAGVSTQLRRDGAVAIARGAVTEIVQNRDDGVEQSWRFVAAPEGEGDLLVTVAVSGHQDVRSSPRGLHFVSSDRLGFSYSHATWVDASRTSWSVPVSWDGRAIVMRVPASVLDRSSFPAVLDPVIGPERAVDSPVAGFTGGAASEPAIARGGSNYLVVWTDDRNGSGRETEIWATRVSSNGTPLDSRGISIARTSVLEHEPALTWTGSEWLVAWTREDATNAGIGAATVSPAGVVTDLGIVANTSGFESQPALASAGSGSALMTFTWNLQIRAMLFSGGSFGAPFNVATTDQNEGLSTVAASGSNYLVAWQAGEAPAQSIRGRIINPGGSNPPSFEITASTALLILPAVDFDGTNYIAVWRAATDIAGARITTAGTVLDPGGVVIAATPDGQTDPAIECGASNCLVAWADNRDTSDPDDRAFDLVAQRFAFDLTPTGGEITINSQARNQDQPSLTTVGSAAYLAVWADFRSGVGSIFGSRVNGDGSVVSPQGKLINTAVRNAMERPAFAVGDTTQLAAWGDSRSFGDDIMAARFDAASGDKLDSAALALSDASRDQTAPTVDFDGDQYVAAWRDTRGTDGDIFAARMSEGGTLGDPSGIPVTTELGAQNSPDLASAPGLSLVVWQDRRNPANGYDIMGAIVASDGSLAATDIPICLTTDEQMNPVVAWDPTSSLFVVAWSDRRTDSSADIYAARVEPDGDVLDSCGVPISTATNWQTAPAIAVSGDQLLVVWEDFRTDFFGDVFGGRITVDAGGITRLDGNGAPIADGASWQTAPTVAGVGLGRWGIAWTDTINENTAGTDILGNTMQSDGSLEPAYLISGGVYFEAAPAFQAGSGDSNEATVVYEYNRPSTGSLRVRRRLITY